MGDRQKRRLAEKRRRQRQRQRAKTDRVAARNEARASVAESTGTRSGEAWIGTVDNVVNQAAEITGALINKDDGAEMAMAAAGAAEVRGDTDDNDAPEGSFFDRAQAWATENPALAGLAAVAGVGAIGVATGVIKLPK